MVIGSVMLFYGADWIVKGGSQLAKYFGLSTIVIGLTVVAFGTSLPELVVSLAAAFEGSSTIAVGNVVGSNIANVGLVLGLSSLVFPLTMKFTEVKIDLGIYMIVCFLFTYFCMDGEIIRMEGVILFACVIAYTWFSITHPAKNKNPEIGQNKPKRIFIKILITDHFWNPVAFFWCKYIYHWCDRYCTLFWYKRNSYWYDYCCPRYFLT